VNTLLDGVHGLVVAAETAIGIDPVGTVDMILRVVEAFERWNLGPLLEDDRLQTINNAILTRGVGMGPAGSRPNGQLDPRKAVPSADVGR
jgi:pyruvate kinase